MDAIDSPVFCTLSMSLSHNLDISDVVAWDEQKSQMNTVCRKSRVNLHINHQQKKPKRQIHRTFGCDVTQGGN